MRSIWLHLCPPCEDNVLRNHLKLTHHSQSPSLNCKVLSQPKTPNEHGNIKLQETTLKWQSPPMQPPQRCHAVL
eukprot:1933077-Amphidinium_carterae.1